jgi:anti-sigma factor ChrR (cupin superfamily)
MAPGQTTIAHEHVGDEEFLVLDGDLIDHDGFRYGPGDLVWLRSGTKHSSYSEGGCLLAVYLPDAKGV